MNTNDNLYALSKIRRFILYSGLLALVQYKSYFLGGRKDCMSVVISIKHAPCTNRVVNRFTYNSKHGRRNGNIHS